MSVLKSRFAVLQLVKNHKMAQYKSRTTKPGAERNSFRPDVIEKYIPQESGKLLEFLLSSMPQRKRTTVKEFLKHNQIAINGIPVTKFDAELNPGDKVEVNLSRGIPGFLTSAC